MKWYKYTNNPTYNNPLTILRENYKYEIIDCVGENCAFTNRKPRKDSEFWSNNFMVWHIDYNAQVHKSFKS